MGAMTAPDSSAHPPAPSPDAPRSGGQRGLRPLLHALWRLARFDRPVGTLLLLWPTLWGLWLAAQGLPDLPRLLVFLAGTMLMRAAGCVLNDIADRRFDGAVARTTHRPLARGEISVRWALVYALVLLGLAASLLPRLNELAQQYASLAVFTAAVYPYTKRFFPFPQAVLGIAFGFGIPMAFADTLGHVPPMAWLLWLASAAWSIAYDTAYAMVDREDDLRLGLRSSAITLGRWDVPVIVACQIVLLGVTAMLPTAFPLGIAYWLAWIFAALYSIRLLLRLKQRRPEDSFHFFVASHRVGALIWAGLFLDFGLALVF